MKTIIYKSDMIYHIPISQREKIFTKGIFEIDIFKDIEIFEKSLVNIKNDLSTSNDINTLETSTQSLELLDN